MKRIAALLAACAAFALCFALAGCGELSPSQVVSNSLDAFQQADSKTLGEYYDLSNTNLDDVSYADLFNAMDSDSEEDSDSSAFDASKYAPTEEQQATFQQFIAMVRDFDYEVGSETIDGDTATVPVTLTTHDMGTVTKDTLTKWVGEAIVLALSSAFSSDVDEDEINEKAFKYFFDDLEDAMEDATAKDQTFDITVNLSKVDGAWHIDQLNDEQTNALLGGILDGINEYKDSLKTSTSS